MKILKKMKKNRKHSRSGFTIVEILVVVIIIAVLAGAVAPKFFRYIGQAKHNVAVQKVTEIDKAIEMFSFDYGHLPNNLGDLVTRPADISQDKWQTPTLRAKDLLDPWEHEFIYKVPGDHGPYDLYSLGKDGQEGGEKEDADVVNW